MRFQLKLENNKYWIIDTIGTKYGMPEHAISMAIKEIENAQSICDILNDEWEVVKRS